MAKADPELQALVRPQAPFEVRVQPKARREAVEIVEGRIRVATTAAPEGGKANKAVAKLLARALGVAPSRLTLLRGETSRDKLFRLD